MRLLALFLLLLAVPAPVAAQSGTVALMSADDVVRAIRAKPAAALPKRERCTVKRARPRL